MNESGDYSIYFPIEASVPQGSVLDPLLYSSFQPTTSPSLLTTFLSSPQADNLEEHLHKIEIWCRKRRVQVNGAKPILPFQSITSPALLLLLYLNESLTWNPHTRLKRIVLSRKSGLLRHLINGSSKVSFKNKINIYESILKPMWTYGVKLWGSAKPANIQYFQSLGASPTTQPTTTSSL